MEIALDQYPDQTSYQLHLTHLLAETEGKTWRPQIKECPIARALLRTERRTQIKILLAALVRRLWILAARSPEALARLFLLNDICRSILMRKLPFESEQLEAVLTLVSEPTAAGDLGKVVLRQLEWQPPLTLCERDALTKFKRVLVHNKDYKSAKRANQLLSAPPPVTASTDAHKWRKLLAHLRRVPQKLSLRWRKKAKGLLLDFGQEIVTQRLLPWFLKNKETLLFSEERFCRGVVAACGEVPTTEMVEFLDEIVLWSYQHVQGRGPRAPRLGRMAIAALGRMGTIESFTHLLALESSSPYESMQKWVRKAQASSARYQGVSLGSLRVDGFLEPPPNTALSRRLARGFTLKLERLLRSGEWISHRAWSRRVAHSDLWRDLTSQLVWESKTDMTLGLPNPEKGEAVRLWHPSEHPTDKSVWRRLVKSQPIQQVRRECYTEPPERPSPPLDQYRFAAMARRRGWDYKMVGKNLASTVAVLEIGESYEIDVRRDDPKGPFHKNGLSKYVVLSPPQLTEQTSPRHISELTRDWNLFALARIS